MQPKVTISHPKSPKELLQLSHFKLSYCSRPDWWISIFRARIEWSQQETAERVRPTPLIPRPFPAHPGPSRPDQVDRDPDPGLPESGFVRHRPRDHPSMVRSRFMHWRQKFGVVWRPLLQHSVSYRLGEKSWYRLEEARPALSSKLARGGR